MRETTTIVGLGEILWDVFPDGPRFGGAPANFACSTAALCRDGARVSVASSVGRDALGDRAIRTLLGKSVDVSGVVRSCRPTGQVVVHLDSRGHASYEFTKNTAWDDLRWSESWQRLAAAADACCFGTLAQRSETSRETVQKFLAETRVTALRIFDVNLRPPFFNDRVILESIRLANVLKLNDQELPVLASLFDLNGTPVEMMQQLANRFELHCVALTRGSDGAILIRGDAISEQPGVTVSVSDTVGAGDAFTAALALGLLEGCDLGTINRTACQVASFVCSQPGATPHIPPELGYQ